MLASQLTFTRPYYNHLIFCNPSKRSHAPQVPRGVHPLGQAAFHTMFPDPDSTARIRNENSKKRPKGSQDELSSPGLELTSRLAWKKLLGFRFL